jgi:hypothetical protein
LMKNPSNLKGLLGFCFGDGIEPNNINDLACRFKSPATTHAIVSAREISQTAGSFRHRYFIGEGKPRPAAPG